MTVYDFFFSFLTIHFKIYSQLAFFKGLYIICTL